MNVGIKSLSGILPEYHTEGSAGLDVRAYIEDEICIKRGKISMVHTGLFFDIPKGFEIQVRARSGLASKHGIGLANGVGTIDSDYTGELIIPLINLGEKDYVVKNNDRIAQILLATAFKLPLQPPVNTISVIRPSSPFVKRIVRAHVPCVLNVISFIVSCRMLPSGVFNLFPCRAHVFDIEANRVLVDKAAVQRLSADERNDRVLFAYGGRSAAGICRNERTVRIVHVDHGKFYVAPVDRSVGFRRHDQFARSPRIVEIGIAQHIRTENIRPQVSLPVLRLRKGGVEIVVGRNPQRYCPYFRRRFRDNGFRFGDDGFRHLTHGLCRRFRSTVRKHVCECTDHQSGKNYRNAGKKPAAADIALASLFIIVTVVIGIVYVIFGFRQFAGMPILNHVLLHDLLFDNLLLYDRMAHRLIFDRRFAVDFPAPLPLRFRIVNGRNGNVR